MKQKNILLTVPTLVMGGMESAVLNFAKELKNQGFLVHIVLLSSRHVFYEIPSGIKVHFAKRDHSNKILNKIVFFKSMFFLRKLCRKVRPIAVFSFSGRHSSYVILSLLKSKFKVFVFDRSSPKIRHNHFDEFLKKVTYPLCEGVVVQTKIAKKIFHKKYVLNKIIVLPNPVKHNQIVSNSIRKNKVIYFGRLIKGKRIDLLIDIFNEIGNKEWQLQIIGDGNQKNILKSKVKNLKITNVEFLDKTERIEFYLNQAKIFAFTSSSEGFPNSLLESMCAGLACISFDCVAGPSDLIQNNINGYLIKEDNIEEYKIKLETLMNNEEIRNHFSNEAKKLRMRHNPEHIVKKLLLDLELNF